MIGEPLNDVACLRKVTERAEAASRRPAVIELAERFRRPTELARWIRTLPQRDDEGRDTGAPTVQCDVSQRLRLPAEDPNCVERSALYLAAAEHLDPRPVRQLATIETPGGRHTFPVEGGRAVVLDPRLPRNALDAGLFKLLDGVIDPTDPREALEWVLYAAEEPAAALIGGLARLRNAERVLSALEDGRRVPASVLDDLGVALALAEPEARLFGGDAIEAVEHGERALGHLLARAPRNRFSIRIGGARLRPNWKALGALARVGSRIGRSVGAAYIRAQLASLGLSPGVLGAVERELAREGLTLGALGEPAPPAGSLAALTTSALLKRRLR